MKMAKKSAAQIRRMQQRATERGEKYNPARSSTSDDDDQPSSETEKISEPAWKPRVLKLAKKLKQSLKEIESNTDINAKERRSEKRKLLAISAEKAECTVDDLVTFLDTSDTLENEEGVPKKKKQKTLKSNPYVLFVGQMAYSTTAAALLEHFQKFLGDHVITPDNFKVRLLTDAKKNRSRGMAFIEANDPKVLFECLKLHHTTLDGRRINVERTTGGGKTSEKRKEKIKQYRQEQQGIVHLVLLRTQLVYQKLFLTRLFLFFICSPGLGCCRSHVTYSRQNYFGLPYSGSPGPR
jgi:RNA recognition motif-containing protein